MSGSLVFDGALSSWPLFTGMTDEEIRRLTLLLQRQRYSQGSLIFREGDRGDALFIVLSGRILATALQNDGSPRKVYEFVAGNFFGEMAIIEEAPRTASCVALEDSELLVLQGTDFYRLVAENPRLANKLLLSIGTVMTSWLDESSKFLNDLVRWGETARKRAVTDELTGLYNRRFLEETLANRFSQGAVGRRKMALLMMDLDRIHGINDRYGNVSGDRVIVHAAQTFRGVLREDAVAARLAGDEFAVLLPDTDTMVAQDVAQRLRLELSHSTIRLPSIPEELSVRVSIGIAIAPDHATDPVTLFSAADGALRRAKDLGRDRVIIQGQGIG